MNKKIIIPSLALTVLAGVGSHAVTTVYAQENNSVHPMMQNIAQRFNLNEDEVANFFKEQRETRMEERKATREEQLNQAVSEGKITEEQKNALLTKMEERKAQRQTHREEMQAWAEENGIDLSVLNLGKKGPEGGKHPRGGTGGM